ncbi:MAG: CD225/dispanin family protein [Trueperaceae bacterium]
MSETPPAGWYPDPQDATQQRYWDGSAWTEHTAGGTAQAPTAAAPATAASSADAPSTWTWQSIVATILCCAPIAVAGALNAGRAEAALKAGDRAAAVQHARRARTWTLWAIGVGLAFWVGATALMVAGSATIFGAAGQCATAEPGSLEYEFCIGLCEGDVRGTPFEDDCLLFNATNP